MVTRLANREMLRVQMVARGFDILKSGLALAVIVSYFIHVVIVIVIYLTFDRA